MIIAVSGWRKWTEKSSLVTVIGSMIDKTWAHTNSLGDLMSGNLPLFRFGDCETGVDALMLELVTEWRLDYERYIADWAQWGKYAGPLRNRAMLQGDGHGNKRANLLLAFPQPRTLPKIPGSGTWGCIGEAAAMGIQTAIYPSIKLTNDSGYELGVFTSG